MNQLRFSDILQRFNHYVNWNLCMNRSQVFESTLFFMLWRCRLIIVEFHDMIFYIVKLDRIPPACIWDIIEQMKIFYVYELWAHNWCKLDPNYITIFVWLQFFRLDMHTVAKENETKWRKKKFNLFTKEVPNTTIKTIVRGSSNEPGQKKVHCTIFNFLPPRSTVLHSRLF